MKGENVTYIEGSNPVKIIRFADGSLLAARGTFPEVLKKADEAAREKQTSFVAIV